MARPPVPPDTHAGGPESGEARGSNLQGRQDEILCWSRSYKCEGCGLRICKRCLDTHACADSTQPQPSQPQDVELAKDVETPAEGRAKAPHDVSQPIPPDEGNRGEDGDQANFDLQVDLLN